MTRQIQTHIMFDPTWEKAHTAYEQYRTEFLDERRRSPTKLRLVIHSHVMKMLQVLPDTEQATPPVFKPEDKLIPAIHICQQIALNLRDSGTDAFFGQG